MIRDLLAYVPPQSRGQWARDAIGAALLFGVGFAFMVATLLTVAS